MNAGGVLNTCKSNENLWKEFSDNGNRGKWRTGE